MSDTTSDVETESQTEEPHWFDYIVELKRLATKTEFPRLRRELDSERPPPPAPGERTLKEIDTLVLSAFRLSSTPAKRAAAQALDEIFFCLTLLNATDSIFLDAMQHL